MRNDKNLKLYFLFLEQRNILFYLVYFLFLFHKKRERKNPVEKIITISPDIDNQTCKDFDLHYIEIEENKSLFNSIVWSLLWLSNQLYN